MWNRLQRDLTVSEGSRPGSVPIDDGGFGEDDGSVDGSGELEETGAAAGWPRLRPASFDSSRTGGADFESGAAVGVIGCDSCSEGCWGAAWAAGLDRIGSGVEGCTGSGIEGTGVD